MRTFRAAVLVAVTLCLHAQAPTPGADPIELADALPLFPDAFALQPATSGLTRVLGEGDQTLGYTLRTLPQTQKIVGYSGPSDVLIALDGDYTVTGVLLLDSGDTREHTEQVQVDPDFPHAFDGWTWGPESVTTNRPAEVDAVSGATLTSLAVIESVAVRLGGQRPSLKFPDPPTLVETRRLFPGAARLGAFTDAEATVFDADDQPLGHVLRTSPHADQINGYQGPSDSLIALGADRKILGMRLSMTFDNQRYVDYIREDHYFNDIFNGMTLDEVAALDPYTQRFRGVDGVSGATMTSVAMIDAVIRRARQPQSQPAPTPTATLTPRLKPRDIATLLAIALGCAIALTHHRGNRKLRVALQLYLVLVLGLWVGDMVSLAVLGGWAAGSVPLKLAPGLVALVAAAFTLPLITGRQVYCQHLCPHGAAQELLFRITPWRLGPPRRLKKTLKLIPLALLVAAVVIVTRRLDVGLAPLEAFDAWVIGVGGGATVAIAVTGLVAATAVPHAYCKYGCPTGLVLDYARASRRDDHLGKKDLFACVLLTIAFTLTTLV
ncbi:MAG: FMN-binding protein [Planctomycetota bacterium]